MVIEAEIRKLARSDYWQTIYNASKDGNNVQLFDNLSCLSGVQIHFLQWLKIYDMLYVELAQRESILLTEKVIADVERCNAYLYIRKQRLENEWFKHQQDKKIDKAKEKHNFKNNDNVSVIDVDLRSR